MTTAASKMTLPRKITLRMERADIASAVCNSRQHCAIAQTIYRQLHQPIGRVRVATDGVSIAAPDNFRYLYKVPRNACVLVSKFDAGLPVEPITFTLHYSHRNKITPMPPEIKSRVNKARRDHTAALAAIGQKPKTYTRGRYGI